MSFPASIKGKRHSPLRERVCRTASGARKSEIGRNVTLLVQACWTRTRDGAYWLLGGLVLAPCRCDVGQNPLATRGCSCLVPTCQLNSSKLSYENLKKRCIKTFPSKLEVFNVRGSLG